MEKEIKGRILHQYFMDKTAARYIFKQGKVAEFFGGVYHTEIEHEIAELDAEIKAGIGSIWKIPGQETVNSLDLDPVAVMKRKIIADYEASKRHSENTGNSVSEFGPVKAAGTGAAGVGAASSNLGAVGAALSNSGVAGAAKTVPVGSINLKK